MKLKAGLEPEIRTFRTTSNPYGYFDRLPSALFSIGGNVRRYIFNAFYEQHRRIPGEIPNVETIGSSHFLRFVPFASRQNETQRRRYCGLDFYEYRLFSNFCG